MTSTPPYSLSLIYTLILSYTSPCSHATWPIPHPSSFYCSPSLYQGGASTLPPLSASCYGAVVNGGLDLSVICMVCACGRVKPETLLCDISFKHVLCCESRHNRFFIEVYYSHFSSYSCFPHIRAICQVTMTGAGTCKQDICIQEIAFTTMCIPTSCHCVRAKIWLHLCRRRKLKNSLS